MICSCDGCNCIGAVIVVFVVSCGKLCMHEVGLCIGDRADRGLMVKNICYYDSFVMNTLFSEAEVPLDKEWNGFADSLRVFKRSAQATLYVSLSFCQERDHI